MPPAAGTSRAPEPSWTRLSTERPTALVTDTLSSQRAKRAIERLLESDELWRLVDRIANSPEVLNAVANASVGLTGVVADEARKRTVTADEFAERVARRVLRRAPREPQPLALKTASGENGPPQP